MPAVTLTGYPLKNAAGEDRLLVRVEAAETMSDAQALAAAYQLEPVLKLPFLAAFHQPDGTWLVSGSAADIT